MFNIICFFRQSPSAQRGCAHMQLLHEAVDAAKWWEKSLTPHFILQYLFGIFRSLVSVSNSIGAVATIVKLWTVDNALITKDWLYSEVCLCSSDTLWSAGQRRRPAKKNRHRASIHRNTLKSMRTHVHLSSIKRTKCALSEYSTSSTYEKKVV
jgi:hypothetical protein